MDKACEVALKAYYDLRVFRSDKDNEHSMQYISEVSLDYILCTCTVCIVLGVHMCLCVSMCVHSNVFTLSSRLVMLLPQFNKCGIFVCSVSVMWKTRCDF